MSTKQSFNGFKRIKWDNKTDSQKAKILENQYTKLGYKVPNYIKTRNITTEQLESALNKIEKGYKRKIENELPRVKMSDIQYEVNKYNKLVELRIKQLSNKGYSEKAINFIKGKHVFLTTSDRSYFANNSLLEKISLDGLESNNKGRNTILKIIKENKKKLSSNNFKNNILSSTSNIADLKNLLYNEETFIYLDDTTKDHILRTFGKLNEVQQEIVIQSIMREIREKYADALEGEKLINVTNNLLNTISNIEKEI